MNTNQGATHTSYPTDPFTLAEPHVDFLPDHRGRSYYAGAYATSGHVADYDGVFGSPGAHHALQ